MAILSIARNFNGNPNLVTIVTDNTLEEILTPGYWELDEIVESIDELQNGEWQWVDTDLVLINYDPSSNGFFTFDAETAAFVINTASLVQAEPFEPTVTFATPGDLSVVYTAQVGFYWKIGNLVMLRARLAFTPTYTTSAGSFQIIMPLINIVDGYLGGSISLNSALFHYPAGATQVVPITFGGSSIISLRGMGDGVQTDLTVTEFPSAEAKAFTVFVCFQTEV